MAACLFCENRPSTLEHVWPQWISRLLHAKPARNQYISVRGATDRPIKGHFARMLGATVRKVCSDCNSGWMGDLENHAKPHLTPLIIDPEFRVVLSAEARVALAAWALKTVMVMEHSSGRKRMCYTPDDRATFRETLTPPDNVYIWMAQYLGRVDGQSSTHHLIFGNKTRGQCATFTIKHLGFQVFALPEGHTVEQNPLWDSSALPLWPADAEDLLWPPLQYFSDSSIEKFAGRWSGAPVVSSKRRRHTQSSKQKA